MKRRGSMLLVVLALSVAAPCAAENHALLIGIDEYQQRDHINSLTAAAADAKGVARVLQDAAGFPPANVRLLTSDGEAKPGGANIIFELEQLTRKVKAGDVVFVLYSGHGIEMDGTTYLLPWDTDARTDATLKRTALSTGEFTEPLKRLPAKAVLLAYDMCRTDPRKGGKAITSHNSLLQGQVKDLVVVARSGAGPGPQAAITLFSCSPQERSWEWRAKGRGYFSYFLEEGLRKEAADAQGTVRVRNLVDYLQKAVYGAVQREEGKDQTPYPVIEGPGATDLVLASGRPPGAGGETAVVQGPGTLQGRLEATLQLGSEFIRLKDYAAAERQFQEALLVDSKSVAAWYMLARVAALQKDRERVAIRLQKVLELDPRHAEATSALGMVRATQGKSEEAERLYIRATELDPQSLQPVMRLGEFYYWEKKDFGRAEQTYHRAMALDPNNAEPVVRLGRLHHLRQNDAEAERLYRRAIQLDPQNVGAVSSLGDLYYRQRKDPAQAEQLYLKAVELDPENASTVMILAEFYYAQKDYPAAERFYRRTIELMPATMSAVLQLGHLALDQRKDYAEAERLYRRALELDPKSAFAASSLGDLYYRKQEDAESERWYRKALEIDPKYVWAASSLGDLYFYRKRDYGEAERWYRKAIELEPGSGRSHAHLAAALLEQNRREAALVAARRAIDLGFREPHPVFEALGIQR